MIQHFPETDTCYLCSAKYQFQSKFKEEHLKHLEEHIASAEQELASAKDKLKTLQEIKKDIENYKGKKITLTI
jgi:uncharacterized membrane protein YcgQ (UPF0703/DUF1980 family)